MRYGILGLAMSASLLCGLGVASTASGEEATKCGSAPDAVTTLPAPLSRWAQVVCTDAGYVITGRDGWLWVEPKHNAVVIIPSQSFGRYAETKDSSSYFTKVEVTKVTGEEFEKAYEAFHTGFDPKDAKPAAYRLDVTTMAGNDIRLYMFDYFTYGWAMPCSKETCDPGSRFVMLNMHEDPKPLPQPI
jgi:hypothetical protein